MTRRVGRRSLEPHVVASDYESRTTLSVLPLISVNTRFEARQAGFARRYVCMHACMHICSYACACVLLYIFMGICVGASLLKPISKAALLRAPFCTSPCLQISDSKHPSAGAGALRSLFEAHESSLPLPS